MTQGDVQDGTRERIEVARTIPAEPSAIFAVLTDPRGHVAIDSSGMLMGASGERVTASGDTFVVHMDREALGDVPLGQYDVTVTIGTFEPDRRSPGRSSGSCARRSGTSTATGSSRPRAAPASSPTTTGPASTRSGGHATSSR
ncbi:hypothetical protein ACFQV8_15765 [Pseudonocardia benzenivorans]